MVSHVDVCYRLQEKSNLNKDPCRDRRQNQVTGPQLGMATSIDFTHISISQAKMLCPMSRLLPLQTEPTCTFPLRLTCL